MTARNQKPELLAPAGSIDAVRAAISNGADSIYLGAGRFNARDDGAQLSLDELEAACLMAHERGRRIYLTLNTLVKPAELPDALVYLADAIDKGIDAAIVQDIGLIRLIKRLFPALELHGSTQMTVHDESGAAVLRELGIDRVVLARENTLEDIRRITASQPGLGLESFIHGALCISYSGQCYMSGMISERSANRGSCAQSCRKDYRLSDAATGATLDEGYLISARDLAAAEHIPEIAAAGVSCLKVEGRKKKPEYVATVTRTYRDLLERYERGESAAPRAEELQPLVQIFSRGFTGGMYGGRQGREYVTRTQPDNVGAILGTVVDHAGDGIVIEVSRAVCAGDGLGFDPPGGGGDSRGFTVERIRPLGVSTAPRLRQVVITRERIPVGWRVVRSSEASLLASARRSIDAVPARSGERKVRLDVRLSGRAGSPLALEALAGGRSAEVRSTANLSKARNRALDSEMLRAQLGRLGETPFALAAIDASELESGVFLPVSELNHLRQRAVHDLLSQMHLSESARKRGLLETITTAVAEVPGPKARPVERDTAGMHFNLVAEVYHEEDARAAAAAGATEVIFDPFLRHPMPPVSRVLRLSDDLSQCGVRLRLRTPTIIRPEDRRSLDKWLATPLPVATGHLGLLAQLARSGRDVVADYAVNCFNQHTAAAIFGLGASAISLSIELTAEELSTVVQPWSGSGFSVVVYGRPEGMTLEHCVLSAAFDREPTTCRDLCVQKHVDVRLTDPAGYTFPVATDSDCRNRLLHSRPLDGSEYIPRLWRDGLRQFRLLLNVPSLPVADLVSGYRRLLESVASGGAPPVAAIRGLLGGEFTRGHFVRAV